MAGRFDRFRDDLLIAIAKYADDRAGEYVDPKDAADLAALRYPGGWVHDSVRALEKSKLVKVTYGLSEGGPDDGLLVTITGEGMDAAEELAAGNNEPIPAADRYVRIDHNSAEYQHASEALQEAADTVRGDNEYAASEPEDREQRLAELEGGMRLLEASRVRLDAITAVLLRALKYLAKKFVDSAIGRLATEALRALAALFGDFT